MKALHITLPEEGFDQIESGGKTIEYKEIKKYWVKRLIKFDRDIEARAFDSFLTDLKNPFDRHNGPRDCMDFFGARFRKIETAIFKNGCVRQDQAVTRVTRTVKSISVESGRPECGARPGEYYFVIELQDTNATCPRA